MTAPLAQQCPACELFLPTDFPTTVVEEGGRTTAGVNPCPNCGQLLTQGPNGQVMAVADEGKPPGHPRG